MEKKDREGKNITPLSKKAKQQIVAVETNLVSMSKKTQKKTKKQPPPKKNKKWSPPS